MHMSKMLLVTVAVAFSSVANAQTPAEVALWNSSWAQYQALAAIPLPMRGMVSQSQQLTVVINGKLKDVYDIYANVYNAIGSHPFLTSVSAIRNTKKSFDFIAYENIPLPDGSIFPLATVAQQRFKRPFYYEVDTYDFPPGIITHQKIVFTRLSSWSVQVTEYLTFEAAPIFIDQAVGGGVFAHQMVQQAVKSKIENNLLKAVKFPKYLPTYHAGDEEDDD
jgi:hypothetical protein